MFKPIVSFLFATFFVSTLQAQIPDWIWHPNGGAKPGDDETRYFRKTFTVPANAETAILTAVGDDEIEVWINGDSVLSVKGWSEAKSTEVSKKIKQGENTIAIRGHSAAGDAAVLLRLRVDLPRRKKQWVVTDASWKTSDKEEKGWNGKNFDEGKTWVVAVSRGKQGVAPWGDVMKSISATPVADLTIAPGFKAELLWSSQTGEGSWICMTTDDKGRLIISPQQDDLPLYRVTLSRVGKIEKTEKIEAPVHQAMGLLYAHDSLYVNGHGPEGTGLYRLIDANKNDRFEASEVHFLKKVPGEGEHGYHALVLGPDKMIYMINGNHTKLVDGISPTSPHQHYEEDQLLPRQWDANGHAVGILAPGGHILRTDPEGKNWELMLAGFRNTYDFDFNADGEIFGFDSDMEWDWGLPWYRPTRIIHAVNAGEYGWRSGSGKFPPYYADTLPAAVDIGVGSPTGVKFGTKSNFPEKYKKALFAMDWSYGRIFAIHFTANGATYDGSAETFIKGKPLNVTDMDFGKDGAMYFITGGRGTQSGLYRVTYEGDKSKEKTSDSDVAAERNGKKARELRHKLEEFYGKPNPKAVAFAWPHLSSDDRWIRYAARTVLEFQPVAEWKDRALSETDANAGLAALLALARVGSKDSQPELIAALGSFPASSLNKEQKLTVLRIIELSFIRQGRPEPDLAKAVGDALNKYYPANDDDLNHELCRILVYLETPGIVTKTMALLDQAKTQEEQVFYVFTLRNMKKGWTLGQHKKYFSWFKSAQQEGKPESTYPGGSDYNVWKDKARASQQHPAELLKWFQEAGRDYGDGASYPKYLVNIRNEAVANLSDVEKIELADFISDKKITPVAKAPAKERQFVKEWKTIDVAPDLYKVASGRNFEKGKAAFTDAQCVACHRFGNEGGAVGPELTAASSKYSRRDILESILEPSKVLSEQFQNFIIIKKDGDDVTGRIVDEDDNKIVIQTNPLAPDRVEVKKADISKRTPSKVSPMPEGLMNSFTENEILDLIAYIESVGKKSAANFRK